MDLAMSKLPIRRSPLISYADRPLSRGIATAVSMGLSPSEGGGKPEDAPETFLAQRSSTGVVIPLGVRLVKATVLSGSGLTIALRDWPNDLSPGQPAAFFSGSSLGVGDIPGLADIDTVAGLHMTLTGTGSVQFEVAP
jgi:hypothetical protein